MLNPKRLGAIILATLMTASAWAAEDAPADDAAGMPMMQHGGGMMMPGHMMPKMHSPMMPMMYPMGQGGYDHHRMHMMGGGMGHMMMYPQMMGGGMGPMMNPQMMQMRMQHMQNMEQRLKNIEALLQQLVDQGKSG